jgi:hypothetical protein
MDNFNLPGGVYMKLLRVCFLLILLTCAISINARAQTESIVLKSMPITINKEKNFIVAEGLMVKIKKSDEVPLTFMISLDDLKKIAAKRNKTLTYNPAQKLLIIGDEKIKIVNFKPNADDNSCRHFGEVLYLRHNNKDYFHISGVYGELGFHALYTYENEVQLRDISK